jgi:hypothetical protein
MMHTDTENYFLLTTYEEMEKGGAEKFLKTAKNIYKQLDATKNEGGLRESYFEEKIRPFFKHNWPKYKKYASENLSRELVLITLLCGDKFPEALALFQYWFRPLYHPFDIFDKINESGIPTKFPKHSLIFIDKIIGVCVKADSKSLRVILDNIKKADPTLTDSRNFQKLNFFATSLLSN